MADAPLHNDLANGPAGGQAFWVNASDAVRLRLAYWPGGDRGTIFLLPGRTEYIEKYGPAASEMAQRGYGTLCIDIRGQGLSDRALPDRMIGDVRDFDEYQRDVDAMLEFAQAQGLPKPFYLLSHSMGGSIALRAMHRGAAFRAAAFSAPMWGILLAPPMRIFSRVVTGLAGGIGLGHLYAPGTKGESYVTRAPFQGNLLTTSEPMYDWMRGHLESVPDLALGGLTLRWLAAALRDCAALQRMALPDVPTWCALGTLEKIVDPAPIHAMMARWPKGRLEMFDGAEHEIMMEKPHHRTRFYDATARLFDANA